MNLFRFTLNNSYGGPKVITEPDGWAGSKLKLDRNEVFHSLVEYYDQPLTFYGRKSGGIDGGLDYINTVRHAQGPNAQITILVEISHDGGNSYDTLWNGLLDMSSWSQEDFYLAPCQMLRNDMWAKFLNRKATPVDLKSTTDLDGGVRAAVSSFTLSLPSQKVRKLYQGNLKDMVVFDSVSDPYTNADYFEIDFDEEVLSEIKTKYQLPFQITSSLPGYFYSADEAGSYAFDIRVELLSSTVAPDYPNAHVDFYFQINNEAPILFTPTNHAGVEAPDFVTSTSYAYAATHTLAKGDQVRIYGDIVTNPVLGEFYVFLGKNNSVMVPSGLTNPTYMNVTADTVYDDTTTDAFLILDAAKSIVSKLVGRDNIVSSSYLTAPGCGAYYALMKGLHVRGYTLAEKPFFLSLDKWWNGVNPVLPLSLRYDTVAGIEKIVIDQLDAVYDPVPVLNLSWVDKIADSYDEDLIPKSIELGYQKWSAESGSGIDDPQSKRTYSTIYKTIGKDQAMLSDFIGASLAIEQTRRNVKEQNKDWRLDDDVMIIALKKSDTTQPELDENFSAISGLFNSSTRYNTRLSVARILKRWINYFSGCLQWTAGATINFASSEGNADMASTLKVTDCDGDGVSLSEKQNVAAASGLVSPVRYKFSYPITWHQYKAMRDNRTKAIGVSRTASNHKACYIKTVEYEIDTGLASFDVRLARGTDPIL